MAVVASATILLLLLASMESDTNYEPLNDGNKFEKKLQEVSRMTNHQSRGTSLKFYIVFLRYIEISAKHNNKMKT